MASENLKFTTDPLRTEPPYTYGGASIQSRLEQNGSGSWDIGGFDIYINPNRTEFYTGANGKFITGLLYNELTNYLPMREGFRAAGLNFSFPAEKMDSLQNEQYDLTVPDLQQETNGFILDTYRNSFAPNGDVFNDGKFREALGQRAISSIQQHLPNYNTDGASDEELSTVYMGLVYALIPIVSNQQLAKNNDTALASLTTPDEYQTLLLYRNEIMSNAEAIREIASKYIPEGQSFSLDTFKEFSVDDMDKLRTEIRYHLSGSTPSAIPSQ
jgi:hypothetical protein